MLNHVGVRKLYVYNAVTKAWHKVGSFTFDEQHLLDKRVKELEAKGLRVRVISGTQRKA